MGFSDLFKGIGGGSIGNLAGTIIGGPAVGAIGGLFGSGIGNALYGDDSANASRQFALDQQQMNIDLQKEFAQSGIQWKVQDAKAAGIHPLYALGANTMSYSPVTVDGGASGPSGMERMGQDISRAMYAVASAPTRQATELSLENSKLQNEMLKAQILNERAKLNAQVGPPMPSSNMGEKIAPVKGVKDVPLERTMSPHGLPQQEVGHIADTAFARTATGLTPVPASNVAERIEDKMIPEAMWGYRNYVSPLYENKNKPSRSLLPPGAKDWEWSMTKFEWQPTRGTGETPLRRWSKQKSSLARDYNELIPMRR